MTAGPGSRIRERLADIAWRIRERLEEIEAGPAVFVAAAFLLLSLAAWIFLGQAALNGVFITTFVLLIWNAGISYSRNDEALDGNDENKGQIEDVKTVLFGNETGTGKHAKGRAA